MADDNVWQVNDLVPLEATFKDPAGTPTNTTVVETLREPDGVVVVRSPTNPSPGVYHDDYPATKAGLHVATFKGTGAVTATQQHTFIVEAVWTTAWPLSARALVTLEETREYVLGDRTDNTQDRKLAWRINAYSEAVYGYTRREWLPQTAAATRRFPYRGSGPMSLSPYDLRAASTIVAFTDYPTSYQTTLTAGTTTLVGDFRLRPTGTDPNTGTYRWIDFDATQWNPGWYRGFEVSVTGDWGVAATVAAVPTDVRLAVLIAVDDSVKNPEGGTARQFGELAITEELETTAEGQRWRALPGESRALLSRFLDDVGLVIA